MKSSASASRFKPYRDVLVYSIPATTSLLIEMLTSLTDALFAGNLPVGGTEALSAITLASPVFGIAMALPDRSSPCPSRCSSPGIIATETNATATSPSPSS